MNEVHKQPEIEEKNHAAGNDFAEDSRRITGSRAYQRLACRSRVVQPVTAEFPFCVGSRLYHVDEVARIGKNIAKMLSLNETLCESIGYGHDIGHPPYSHIGDLALSELAGISLKHGMYGVFIAQKIEKLNLTPETLRGIMLHTDGFDVAREDFPDEYRLTAYADVIEWVLSDVDDAVACSYLYKEKVPAFATKLGDSRQERICTVVDSLVDESKRKGEIKFSEGPVAGNFWALKDFLVEEVYSKLAESRGYEPHKMLIRQAYKFFGENFPDVSPLLAVHDLTDAEANHFGKVISETKDPKEILRRISHFGVFGIMHQLKGMEYSEPDLKLERQ